MADKYDGWHDNWDPKFGNFEVPDPSEYTSIEGIWQLEYTRNYLAKHGLKDPWMRNEICRYPRWYKHNPLQSISDLALGKNFIGLKYGFLAAAGLIICQNIYWRLRYGERPLHRDNLLDWIAEYNYARDHPNQ